MTTGIILLAGNSIRYNKGINKNLELLDNQYVFLYSLNVFLKNENVDDIILVIRKIDENIINKIIANLNTSKPIKIIIGGSTRMESVYLALLKTNSNYVVIHDAARPMIKNNYIDECLDSLKKYDGAVIGVKAKDTIKIVNEENEVIKSTNRNNTWIVFTPQAFKKNILIKQHEKYRLDDTITDDSMLLEKDNYKVKIIEGDYTNIKITLQEDLEYIKILKLKNKKNKIN